MVLNDPKTPLSPRNAPRSRKDGFTEVYDRELQDVGHPIANTTFDLNNVLIYDVRGMYAFFIHLFNINTTKKLNYKLQFLTLETNTPTENPEVDWIDLVGPTEVAPESWSNSTIPPDGNNISEFIRATPKMTYCRISLHMETGAFSTNITGVFCGV